MQNLYKNFLQENLCIILNRATIHINDTKIFLHETFYHETFLHKIKQSMVALIQVICFTGMCHFTDKHQQIL